MTDEVAEPKTKKASKPKYEGPACQVCGKPLTDPESVKAGIGPLCRANGWTKEMVEAKRAELKADAVPEGYIPLAEVARKCRVEGIPVARLVRAVGGDRGMSAPLNDLWRPVYVGNKRYLNPAVVTPEEFGKLGDRNLGKPVEPKAPRAKKPKAEKPEGEGKSGRAKRTLNPDAFNAAQEELG